MLTPRVTWIRCAMLSAAAWLGAVAAHGDTDTDPNAPAIGTTADAGGLPADSEAGKLDFYYGPAASRFGEPLDGVLAPWDRLRDELRDRFGLDYFVSISPIVQLGSWSDDSFTAHYEIDFIGQWSLIESERWGIGGLRWWWLHIQTTAGANVSQFSSGAGSAWGLNGGGTPGTGAESIEALGLFWYEHLLFDERLRVVVGKLDARQLFSRLNHVGDDRQDFFAEPLSNRPVQPAFSRAGVGVFASWSWDLAYVSAMWKDAEADNRHIDFGSVGEGHYDYAVEVGFTPEFEGLGAGRYRFTYFYSDANRNSDSSGWGVALSFDQDVSERLSLFARFSHAERQQRALETLVTAGVIVHGVARWPQDTIGVGLVWASPSDDRSKSRDQYGMEIFWNMRITRRFELSPDLQILVNPAHGSSHFEVAAGLRLRFVL